MNKTAKDAIYATLLHLCKTFESKSKYGVSRYGIFIRIRVPSRDLADILSEVLNKLQIVFCSDLINAALWPLE